MKNTKELTYPRLFALGILSELVLIAFQFIYINIYAANNHGTVQGFTSDYMQDKGFYIFQVVGFFVYSVFAFLLNSKIQENILYKLLAFLSGGAIAELTFYLVIQADYQGVYFYSILDKVMAAIFGTIVFYYTTPRVRKV